VRRQTPGKIVVFKDGNWERDADNKLMPKSKQPNAPICLRAVRGSKIASQMKVPSILNKGRNLFYSLKSQIIQMREKGKFASSPLQIKWIMEEQSTAERLINWGLGIGVWGKQR
jgi:hypothetical protein